MKGVGGDGQEREVRESGMRVMRVTRFSAESGLRNPLRLSLCVVRECWDCRGLMWTLMAGELRAQYRQSYLGYLWLIVPVFSTTIVWAFLESANVIKVEQTRVPYAVFVLVGSIVWTLFSTAVMQPLASFNAAQTVLMKLKVPPEAFIFAGLGKLAFDVVIRVFVLFPVFLTLKLWPAETWFLFPFGLIVAGVVGTAVGYALIPLGALYGDVPRLVSTLLSFGLYLTPVVYPPPDTGFAAKIMQWSPIAQVVIFSRDWLTIGYTGGFPFCLMLLMIALAMLFAAVLVLRAVLPVLVERMGM